MIPTFTSILLFLALSQQPAQSGEDDYWPDFPVSSENASRLASGVLETLGHNKIIAAGQGPQECPRTNDHLSDQICSQERLSDLIAFDQKQQGMMSAWSSEATSDSGEIEQELSRCHAKVDGLTSKLDQAQAWVNDLFANPPSSENHLREVFRLALNHPSLNFRELRQRWRAFCRAEDRYPAQESYAEFFAHSFLVSYNNIERSTEFCLQIESKSSDWIKSQLAELAASNLFEHLQKAKETGNQEIFRDLTTTNLRDDLVTALNHNQRPAYIRDSVYLPTEQLDTHLNQTLGQNCSTLSRFSSRENQMCSCMRGVYQRRYNDQIEIQMDDKVVQAQEIITRSYQAMVENSLLSASEKAQLLHRYPAPKIKLSLSGNALSNASYNFNSSEPPYGPHLNLSAAMIDEITKSPLTNNGELSLGVAMHEMGHHFFTATIGSRGMVNDLSPASRARFEHFTNCLDQATVEREFLPAIRDEIIAEPARLSTLMSRKRPEIGADFFALSFNRQQVPRIATFSAQNFAALNCLHHEHLDETEDRQRHVTGTHTEPQARMGIALNPPACGQILWP